MHDDGPLLREYTEHRSETAFGELVSRHVDTVYSAALRVGHGDTHLAQDVVQQVFTDLARKAGGLPRDVVLAGWLYRHACFTAAKMIRTERRRQTRELIAMETTMPSEPAEAGWEQVAPVLDDAMNQLPASDRDAIVLRFFGRKDFRAVGTALGVNEDTAQKRVSRALEKLRTILKQRGATLTVATLGSVLAGEAVTAAPAGLAVAVSTAALAAAATTGVGLTLIKLMAMTKLKVGIASALVVAGVATPLVLQQRALNQTRSENRSLQKQVGALTLSQEENERLAKLKIAADELERLRKEHAELLRLRGDATALRRLNEELAKRPGSNAPGKPFKTLGASPFIPVESIVDAGLATPEAAVQTFAWAIQEEDEDRFKEVMDVRRFYAAIHEARHQFDPDFDPEEEKDHDDNFSFKSFKRTGEMKGIQILSQQFNSPDDAEVEVALTSADGSAETNRFMFHRTGTEWKLDMLAMAHPESLEFYKEVEQPDGTKTNQIVKLKVEQRMERKLVPVEPPPTP